MGRPQGGGLNMHPDPILDAGPIELRRWDVVWLDQLVAAIEDSLPELRPFMPWANGNRQPEDSRNYIEQCRSEWESGIAWNYAMLTAGSEDAAQPNLRVVGSCGLMTRMGPGILEIGYWVHSAYAGRGYATAAATTLARAGLRLPGIERIAIRHDAANPASGRVAEKAGFTHVRDLRAPREAPGQTGLEWLWEMRYRTTDT
jgi:ribosomal-protein-serine acetyltransferase